MARRQYTKEDLTTAAKESISISGVIRHLGKRWSGGMHSHIRNRLKFFEIDTAHFLGQRANRGEKHKGGNAKRHWRDVLKYRTTGRRERAKLLRRALVDSGVSHTCVGIDCGLAQIWKGKPLTLEINHKNGNNIDDRKENLEFLCPNCHSQIPNHGSVAQLAEATRLERVK